MRENNFGNKDARPCTITSTRGGDWNAMNASVFRKDERHAYVYDPNGGLPDIDITYILSIKNRQRTFMYSVVPEEAFDFGRGSICLCKIEYSDPAAMKFFLRLKESEVLTGDISDILRGVPGCEVKI